MDITEIDASSSPPVQIIGLRINGEVYNFFGPVILPEDASPETLDIQEIGFFGITDMGTILKFLVKTISEENDLRKSMQ